MGPTYTAPYTYTRLFNAAGVQLAIGNYGSEPELNMFVLPASGTYYIGVSMPATPATTRRWRTAARTATRPAPTP